MECALSWTRLNLEHCRRLNQEAQLREGTPCEERDAGVTPRASQTPGRPRVAPRGPAGRDTVASRRIPHTGVVVVAVGLWGAHILVRASFNAEIVRSGADSQDTAGGGLITGYLTRRGILEAELKRYLRLEMTR